MTEKSDIYSLGALLWGLTSCLSPFKFENLENFEKERIAFEVEKKILFQAQTKLKFFEIYQSKIN